MNANMHILRLAKAYADARGIQMTSVAVYAAGQAHVFNRLEGGSTITMRRYDRLMQWFSDHWPVDLPWPTDIPRPTPSPDSPAAAAIQAAQAARTPLTELNEDRQIASPSALCQALGVRRYVYDQVIRHYADGRPRQHKIPRRGCASRRVFDALIAAGDQRFESRRDQLELARQLGF